MKEKRKICHLSSVHPVFDTRIFHRECTTLARARYDVALIVPHDRDENVDGVQIRAVPKAGSRLTRTTRTIWQVYQAALEEHADLYHFHDPELIPVGLLLKVRCRVPVIYDVHEYYSEVIPSRAGLKRTYGAARFLCHYFLERMPKQLFDALVFPTTSLQQAYAENAKSVALLNLPSCRDVRTSGSSVAWEEREFDTVFVGTITPPRMGFSLEVAKMLAERRRNFKWLFLGLPEDTARWVHNNYEHAFLARHIHAVGRVPYNTVLNYLGRSRVGFNYHPFEKRFLVSIPMKVFEYMSAGLPVVTTALPELVSLLTPDNTHALLINSQHPGEYAAAMDQLLTDPTRAMSMGLSGQTLVANELNWEQREACKLLALYDGLLQ